MELEEHPFFQESPGKQVRRLIRFAQIMRFAPDEVIFEEGSDSDALYLVLEGRVTFVKQLPTARDRSISYAEAGDFFGEIGLFTGQPRALDAVAGANGATLARIGKENLVEFINQTPGPIEKIMQSIVSHLEHTTRHYVEDMLQQEKMAVVGSMVNTIIHDFKNPFTLISLSAQLLASRNPSPETQKFCNTIESQIRRMVDMANELAEFSRGEQRLNLAKVNLADLMDRFRELNEPYFQNQSVKLSIAVDPVIIEAEEAKLLRVLQNLVSNSIDAVADIPDARVEVTARSSDADTVEITVADNGKGIPAEIKDKFFEPFVTHGKSRGTGLGTAIVKSIVTAHGGTITFESGAGKGTTILIRLPKRQNQRLQDNPPV